MLAKEEAKAQLLQYLHPYFEHKKYAPFLGGIDFGRITSFGCSSVVCSVSGGDDRLYISFFLGIRHNLVEEMLKSLFGPSIYYTQHSHTLLPSWHFLSKEITYPRVACLLESDIVHCADLFIDFMDRSGFDFLNYYKSLERICSLLNDKPRTAAIWSNHNYHRCFRAMASASLLNRQDYDRLYLMHQQYMAERGFSGSIMEKYNSTFARLKTVSHN